MWLDLNNEDCALPEVDGKIIVKAHRLSWHEEVKQPEGAIRKANSDVYESDPVQDLK